MQVGNTKNPVEKEIKGEYRRKNSWLDGIGGERESGSCLRAGRLIDFPSSHFTSNFTMDPQKQLQALTEEFQGMQTGLYTYLFAIYSGSD